MFGIQLVLLVFAFSHVVINQRYDYYEFEYDYPYEPYRPPPRYHYDRYGRRLGIVSYAAKPGTKARAKAHTHARAKGPPPVVSLGDDPPKAVSARGQGPPPVVDWLDENGSLKAGKGSIKARSFFTHVTGFLSGGKCIIICVATNIKNCPGLISCVWTCFGSKEDMTVQPNPEDKDISVNSNTTSGMSTPEPNAPELGALPTEKPDYDDVHHEPGGALSPVEIVETVVCAAKCLTRYLPRTKLTLQQFLTCIVVRCFCADS